MYSFRSRLCLWALAWMALWCGGCTELFLIFGPGGAFGPPAAATSGSTSSSTNTTITPPSFQTSALDPQFETTAGAKVVAVADMNGDGFPDVVSGSDESQPIQLHLHNGLPVSFNLFTIAGGGPIARMIDLRIADFDSDGNPDVAVLVQDTGFVPVVGASIRGAVVLLFAPSDPTNVLSWTEVTISATFVISGDGLGLTAFEVADIDGDTRPDIVLASNETGSASNIRLYFNPGGATARNGGSWIESAAPVEADVNPIRTLVVGDLDQDGDTDVVAGFPQAKTANIRWLVNPLVEAGPVATFTGAWTRRFVGQQAEVDPNNQGADLLDVEDINNDGFPDVAAAHAGLGVVQWFENPGAGFISLQTFPWRVFDIGQLQNGVVINQLQLVDLNLDSQVDVFVTASGNMVGFQPGAQVQDRWLGFSILATNPVADIGRAAFADVNFDGRRDIIAPLDRPGVSQDQFLIFTRLSP